VSISLNTSNTVHWLKTHFDAQRTVFEKYSKHNYNTLCIEKKRK